MFDVKDTDFFDLEDEAFDTIVEDDTAEDEFSIIDALYYLKHGVPQKSKCEVKDDLTRDEVDMLFKDDEVPQKFKDK